MIQTWLEWAQREQSVRPRSWAGAAAAALIVGVCGADAQSSLPFSTPDASPSSPATSAPPMSYAPVAMANERSRLKQAFDAAQSGDISTARSLQAGLADPVARKLVLWAMIDSAGSSVDFYTLDSAQKELAGWPRAARRQAVAEKAMALASISPSAAIAWFAAREPSTPEGAMALASAYQQSARIPDAQALIRTWWRGRSFGPEQQSAMLSRFGIYLTADDHAQRLSTLLYSGGSASASAMMQLVGPEQRSLAEARLALRGDRGDAMQRVGAVAGSLQSDPGLAFDRARYLRKHNLDTLAVGYARNFPKTFASQEAASTVWTERRALMMAAIRSGDSQGAYQAVANHGLTGGADLAEAEFFAGWVALNKLKNPTLAEQHFARVQASSQTPITQSRALYWRGRAAAARGDAAAAQTYWSEGGQYVTAFYGQLAAEKAGITKISLPAEPTPTAADRTRFEGREIIRAARMLGDLGEKDAFRAFVLTADDVLPDATELGLLVDMARLYGEQDLSMRVVRAGAMRNLILPVRGYPVRVAPQGYGLPEPAFTLAITRQESGFDPLVRSPVGARGMMQLMPGTAQAVARRIGVSYSAGAMDDPGTNMRLGASYLGQITDELGGSYAMAAAGYNAGPGRARQWAAECGDPRQSSVDPADFVECIPFAETRNYVMRIMENMQVYRARLNGGTAPLTLTADLHRGGWSSSSAGAQQASAGQAGSGGYALVPGGYAATATPASR